MMFKFNNPWILLLIPLAAAFVILLSRKMVRIVKWRRISVIALRIIVFTLIITCLAGPGIRKVSNSSTTIFVTDGSDSVSRLKAEIEKFVKDAIKNKDKDDKVGIVNFGADASVEITPSENPGFSSIQTKVNSSFTNIQEALKLASSLIPAGDRKRIVLISDGAENAGDSLKQARLLKQQNIQLDIFRIDNIVSNEVQLKEIMVPEVLRKNEKFQVIVKVVSTVKTSAVLRLYADRQLVAEKNVEISEGDNNFAFQDDVLTGGMITYTAEIVPETDTIIKNNSMSTFTYVEDAARMLIIQDTDNAASELIKILKEDVYVDVSSPESVPVDIKELQKYDAFIISNVSAEKFDDRFLDNLKTVIQHQGKGLLVTGGENSYAPGGYYKTPLEEVLPVNMDIKPKEELPNLGLVLVIDKSGSMSSGQYGVSKVELAKEAAIRATEVLRSEDMIGVIAFDDAVQWVVKTQKVTNLEAIQNSIGTIRSGGGTQILPAVEEAYLSLKDADTKLKHIILLTDGQAERTGYQELIENMREAGITLSTVAVGTEADRVLLKALAEGGSGRFYMTDEFTDIPKIFAKETFLAGKTYLNNRTFTPNYVSSSEILKGIDAVPVLDGYVGTSAKSTAKVILTSDRDEPILASWQYGLGRTVAWTPDAKGMWTSAWMQWSQSPVFWKNIVSWIVQERTSEEYTVKGSLEGGKGVVELTLPSGTEAQAERVEAVIVSPTGQEQSIILDPTTPQNYKGVFDSSETGVYIANINISNIDGSTQTVTSGIVIPYSPEYDIENINTESLVERLAYESGGRVITSSSDVFSGDLPPVVSITNITSILLILAILLLMMDIAIRRLNISFKKVEVVVGAAMEKSVRFTQQALKPLIVKVNAARTNRAAAKAMDKALKDKPANAGAADKASAKVQKQQEKKNDNSTITTLLNKKKKWDGDV